MAEKINLRSSKVKEKQRQVQSYGTQTPLSSTAVERGTTRWLNESTIIVEGLLDVTGTLNGSGTNNFGGENNLSGTNNLSGINHLTGPTDVAGNFEIVAGGLFKAGDSVIRPDGSATFGGLEISPDGKLAAGSFELNPDGSAKFGGLEIAIDGKLTSGLFELNPDGSAKFGDLTIDADGTITTGVTVIETTGRAEFGDFVIDPSSNKLIQAPGGWLFSDGPDSLGLASSNTSSISLDATKAELNYGSSTPVIVRARAGAIDLTSPRTNISGQLWVEGAARFSHATLIFANLPTTPNPPNLHITSAGNAYRSTWTP